MKNNIRVAILDTGIDKNHEYLKDNIIGGISLKCDDKYILICDDYEDDNGHGTACASIIKKEFENVEIFVVKVLDKDGKSNVQVLEEALKYLLDKDIKIINLSLSIIESEVVKDLKKICDKLNAQGKIIVCSLANGYEESFPAIFENVIGVKGFILEDENSFWYNRNKNIQCIMDNNSYMNCYINNSYKLFGKCNSQAAAKLTGKVAKILSEYGDMKFYEINKKLELLGRRSDWTSEDLIKSKRFPNFKDVSFSDDYSILNEVSNVIIDFLGAKNCDLYKYSLFNKSIGLTEDNCYELIKILEKKFKIGLDYLNISRYDFVSIYTLVDLINKKIKSINFKN
ncbi:S8 family serine peptidase [Paraclostridium sordellii]|uniref:Serine protease n=1 Tax=Paraclostridium sordellii TaxID=1505 RepID=A0A9P1P7W1_PARSO|nr:S8 family serine peptidase [Paeniclostridium sordellii]CEN31379.1 serine protease [[Clostridium] sordellii] [Paeniclostridium sordellii]